MRIDHAHGDEIAGIRDAVHADAAVVVRNILDQPVDGVVGVGAFVHGFLIAGIGRGVQHFKFACGAVAPTNILKDKNVAVGKHVGVAVKTVAHTPVASGNSVRSSFEKYRQRFLGVLRRVNFGV